MPYTVLNVKKLIRETSKLLKKLKLDDRNADFSIWRWERFDCGFDVSVEHPEIFMSLLDKSIYVNAAKKRCRRMALVVIEKRNFLRGQSKRVSTYSTIVLMKLKFISGSPP